MAMLLLIAGHETTANLIGNAVLGLLTHPDQLALLRADPALLPGAVEEFLRYDTPVHNAPVRFAAEDVEVAGTTIPAGAAVQLSLGAANRDPDRVAGAAELRIDRDASGHVAFGHGLHFCLGAQLARIEGAGGDRRAAGPLPRPGARRRARRDRPPAQRAGPRAHRAPREPRRPGMIGASGPSGR